MAGSQQEENEANSVLASLSTWAKGRDMERWRGGKEESTIVRWGEARRIRIQKPRDLCAFKALNGKQVHEVQSDSRSAWGEGSEQRGGKGG